jgi:hypothetical protein
VIGGGCGALDVDESVCGSGLIAVGIVGIFFSRRGFPGELGVVLPVGVVGVEGTFCECCVSGIAEIFSSRRVFWGGLGLMSAVAMKAGRRYRQELR